MVCVKCKVDKEAKCFTRCTKKLNGLNSYCKNCVNDYKKAKREQDKIYKSLYEF
jgi:hypothetical protein